MSALGRSGWLFVPFFPAAGATLVAISAVGQRTGARSIVVFMPLLMCGSVLVYFMGREHFSGGGASALAAAYYFFVHAIPAMAFLWRSPDAQIAATRVLSFSIVAFVALAAAATCALRPDLILERKMYLPLLLNENNSTGLINSVALAAAAMMFICRERRLGFLMTALAFVLAIIWLNRTGLFIASAIWLTWLLTAARWRTRLLFVVTSAGLLYWAMVSGLLEGLPIIDRLLLEGVASPRWETQGDALNNMLDASSPLGGYESIDIYGGEWIHNMVLDAYRLAGIPAAAVWSLFLVWTLLARIFVCTSLDGLAVWALGFLVAMTAVVFESHPLEFVIVIVCLASSVRLPSSESAKL